MGLEKLLAHYEGELKEVDEKVRANRDKVWVCAQKGEGIKCPSCGLFMVNIEGTSKWKCNHCYYFIVKRSKRGIGKEGVEGEIK